MESNAFQSIQDFSKALEKARKYLRKPNANTSKRGVMSGASLKGTEASFVMRKLVEDGVLKQSKTKAGQVRYTR